MTFFIGRIFTLTAMLFFSCMLVPNASEVTAQDVVWEEISPRPGIYYTRIAAMEPNGLAVTNVDSIFFSLDNGVSWEPASPINSVTQYYDIYVLQSGNVVVSTNNGIYITTDLGSKWARLDTMPASSSSTFTQFLETQNGDYYARSSSEFIKSTNQGVEWTEIPTPYRCYSFDFGPDGILYAIFNDAIGHAVGYSTNNGTSWNLYPALQADSHYTRIHSDFSSHIYIESLDGLVYGEDFGDRWDWLQHRSLRWLVWSMLIIGPKSFYVALSSYEDENIILVLNNGEIVINMSGNLPNYLGGNRPIREMVFDSKNRLVAATARGLFRTTQPVVTSPPHIDSPHAFSLSPAYPNPVETGSAVTVDYTLPSAANTSLALYNTLGREMLRREQRMQPGSHNQTLPTHGLAPGVYYYTLSAGEHRATKMLVVR